MNKKQRVFSMLKPKVSAYGFNKKELLSIAAKIADNLTSEDDASDEDLNAEIEKSIDAIIPYLQVGQSFANRVIDENRKKNEDDDEIEDEDDDESSATHQSSSKKKNPKKQDETPEWAKSFVETVSTLKDEISSLKADKVTTSRRSKLEAILKDTGTFGTRTLKSFGKMSFENDDDFEDFLSEVSEDLKSLNQERANAGLENLGIPAAGGGKKEDENKPLTDDEVDALVESM